MKKIFLALALIVCTLAASAQNYKTETGISYRPDATDKYQKERCKLDFYYPTDVKDFPVVIWYHGGGLTGGNAFIPGELQNQGIGVVAVNYRICGNKVDPSVTTADCVDDAAAAAAWAVKNVAKYGGSPDKIYLTGHSAGGYLVMMIGFDKARLGKYGVEIGRAHV